MIERAAARDVAERAARESYGKLLAYLARRCGGLEPAEDALADAFTAALERWPVTGIPRVPEAWLLVTAKRRILDRVRREERAGRFRDRLVAAARDAERLFEEPAELGDDRLALMFACANPAIAVDVRAPLILQAILGLDAARIASAFLVAPATMSQRLVRAKRKIAQARVPLGIPGPDEFAERLDAVLAAIYATFAEGWGDPEGSDGRTRGLATEAIWLARALATSCPDEPEAVGLLALMLYADARRGARRNLAGDFVPLDEQDVARWNVAAIDEAEALLERAAAHRRMGRFQIEAAIQSAHVARRFGGAPDWRAIVALYDELHRITGSPVVALNRVAALGRLRGPATALDALALVESDARLRDYQPYWATRADLLAGAGRRAEALDAFARAAGLTVDPAVRRYFETRMEAIRSSGA